MVIHFQKRYRKFGFQKAYGFDFVGKEILLKYYIEKIYNNTYIFKIYYIIIFHEHHIYEPIIGPKLVIELNLLIFKDMHAKTT